VRRLAAFLLAGACGPIPVNQAERVCLESARAAQQPRGEVGVGISSGGDLAGVIDVTVSSDWVLGRDPNAIFNRCVQRRSGQMPTRPLSAMPQ
jgi:hypothetical protein